VPTFSTKEGLQVPTPFSYFKFRVYRVQLVLKMYGLDTTLPLNKAALERKNGKASKQMRQVNWLDELQGIRHETETKRKCDFYFSIQFVLTLFIKL
jgi:hypothetical protein